MKRLLILLGLIAAPALAYGPRAAGIYQALTTIRSQWAARTKTRPVTDVLCIRWMNLATSAPDGTYHTTRISGAVYADIPTFTVGPEQVVLEVQAQDGDPTLPATLPDGLEVLDMNAVDAEIRATPLFPQCEAAVARATAAQPEYRCSCWDGINACTFTDPVAGTSACKLGMTMPPGAGTGTGAVHKACTTRYATTDDSWPAGCPG